MLHCGMSSESLWVCQTGSLHWITPYKIAEAMLMMRCINFILADTPIHEHDHYCIDSSA